MREIPIRTDATGRQAELRRAEVEQLAGRHADAIARLELRLQAVEQEQQRQRELMGVIARER